MDPLSAILVIKASLSVIDWIVANAKDGGPGVPDELVENQTMLRRILHEQMKLVAREARARNGTA